VELRYEKSDGPYASPPPAVWVTCERR